MLFDRFLFVLLMFLLANAWAYFHTYRAMRGCEHPEVKMGCALLLCVPLLNDYSGVVYVSHSGPLRGDHT